MSKNGTHWSGDVFREMRARDIITVCTVPDGGLTQLLDLIGGEGDRRAVASYTRVDDREPSHARPGVSAAA